MRCPWCESEVVLPSERKITVDRGRVFEAPVPAIECTACGKMFAPDSTPSKPPKKPDAPKR
jgi:YgiT-type zinc finger domain-containing protein